jgi:hypothetical protein
MNSAATIKLFLLLGDAKRLRTVEVSNWTGMAIAAPRSDLDQFLTRPELAKPGIYVLLGVDPEDGNLSAYIGEAEAVSNRVKQHKQNDFWNTAIAFVSKDENLTKSHVRYLEGRLIELAGKIGRYKLLNTQATSAKLPESDQSDMEFFLERVIQLFPVLGSDLLTPIAAQKETGGKQLIFRCKMKKAEAMGQRTPNGFVVFKGSTAVLEERASAGKQSPWTIKLRQRLRDDGTLVEQNGLLYFSRDAEFSSPSAAAAVIHGGSAAGPLAWKDDDGRTLKEVEG